MNGIKIRVINGYLGRRFTDNYSIVSGLAFFRLCRAEHPIRKKLTAGQKNDILNLTGGQILAEECFVEELRKKVSVWFAERKEYERRMIITGIILLAVFWLLMLSDIREWWKWDEWMEHIKKFHM